MLAIELVGILFAIWFFVWFAENELYLQSQRENAMTAQLRALENQDASGIDMTIPTSTPEGEYNVHTTWQIVK